MIRDINHVNIRTPDVSATKAFFIDVLGLEEGWRPGVSTTGAWLYAGGRPLIHLSQAPEGATRAGGAGIDHFAFSIEDFDAMKARLDALGTPYKEVAFDDVIRIRQLNVFEPGGVKIELNWSRDTRAA